MKYKVFIDGAEGTTGLKIHQYFEKRDDIELLHIDAQKRKDFEERLALIKRADVSFLCLPDAAAREIAAAAPAGCRILDTSTAHRTDSGWVYGMPELCKEQRDKIRNSNRVAVPGCHATGVILLITPLIKAGILPPDYPFSAYSLTGYSGGGKKMIAEYEGARQVASRHEGATQSGQDQSGAHYADIRQQGLSHKSVTQSGSCQASTFKSDVCHEGARESEPPHAGAHRNPKQYGITQAHKHLPEIVAAAGLSSPPAFMPVVADYYSGMEVTVPVRGTGAGSRKRAAEALRAYYAGQPLVKFVDSMDENGFIDAGRLAGKNTLEITVTGNDENMLLIATYDNLGKGASGAAIQNMNIMLGIDETKGLI